MAWNEFDPNSSVGDIDRLVRERIQRDKDARKPKSAIEWLERDQQNHRPSDGVGSPCTQCSNPWPCESLRVVALELD